MKRKNIYLLFLLSVSVLAICFTCFNREKRTTYMKLSNKDIDKLAFFEGDWFFSEDNESFIITINHDSIVISHDNSIFKGNILSFKIDGGLSISSENDERTIFYSLDKIGPFNLFLMSGNPIEWEKGNSGTMGIELIKLD